MKLWNRVIVTGMFVSSAVLLSGCLISGSSHETMSGQFVGQSTFAEIEPGRTTDKWVLGALGEPSSKSCLDDGSSLWKWVYKRDRSSNSSVFLVFGGSSRRETEGATFVQFRDGVVTKAWQD